MNRVRRIGKWLLAGFVRRLAGYIIIMCAVHVAIVLFGIGDDGNWWLKVAGWAIVFAGLDLALGMRIMVPASKPKRP